eukprot:8374963-Prorocentrum_lima.AAC.1
MVSFWLERLTCEQGSKNRIKGRLNINKQHPPIDMLSAASMHPSQKRLSPQQGACLRGSGKL